MCAVVGWRCLLVCVFFFLKQRTAYEIEYGLVGSEMCIRDRSSLGGQNNLRGFGLDRYIDKHLIAFSIEERIHILRTKLAGVTADFEVAPFLDTGQVFNSFKDVSFQDYRMTPGLGFRAIVRPNVVGRVDYGYSREGGAVFAGLDFPY